MIVRAFLAFLPALAACAADTFVTGDGGDAGSDAPSGPTCGSTQCQTTDTCCVSSVGSFTCLATCPAQQSGNAVAALQCTSSADCANGVCCMQQTNGNTTSACAPQCDTNQVQLCDPASADAGCPATEPCSSSNIADWKLPQSFGTCGGVTVP